MEFDLGLAYFVMHHRLIMGWLGLFPWMVAKYVIRTGFQIMICREAEMPLTQHLNMTIKTRVFDSPGHTLEAICHGRHFATGDGFCSDGGCENH